MKTTKAKVKVINPITSETIPPEEFSKISHFETILEVTGTPKNISLGVKEIADRLINERTRISKSKDDIRGPKIIDGYESAHESAEDDSVVKLVREDCENMSVMISKYMSNL